MRFRTSDVFRECKKKVEDCKHLVPPLGIPAGPAIDPKIKTLAYSPEKRTLEIALKNGQVWQLLGIQPDVYEIISQQTISSFCLRLRRLVNPL